MRLFLAIAGVCCLLAGCGYGPRGGEKARQLFYGDRIADARDDLNSTDAETRRWAVVRLARYGDPSVTEAIVQRLEPQTETVPFIRAIAAAALGEIGDKRALPSLVKASRDPDAIVRADAARSIGTMGGAPEARVLAGLLLSDPAARVRLEAAFGLGHIGGVDALSALSIGLDDPDESVAFAAHDSLRRLTSQDLPPSRGVWDAWLRQHPPAR